MKSETTNLKLETDYIGLPWKDGGNDRSGVDCRGLVLLWLREQLSFDAPIPESHKADDETADQIIASALTSGGESHVPATFVRGDVLFFRHKLSGRIRHVAVCIDDNKILHALKGCGSQVVNGTALICRLGFDLVGVINAKSANESSKLEALAMALSDRRLGDPWDIALLVLSIALSAASAFLMPKPKLGQFRNETGRYGFDQLFTQTSTQIPLPDLLGGITIAGNSPYQSLIDKTQPVSDATSQKVNKVVILGAGPFENLQFNSSVVKINGTPYTNSLWHPSGMALNPPQDKANCIDGLIGGDSNRPSITYYPGDWDSSVPVDIRAYYDRNFPIYGFTGCAYLVFRLIDSTKFSQFNMTATIKGRKCRTFTTAGFDKMTVTGETMSNYSNQNVTVDASADTIGLSNHTLRNGDPVTFSATTLPGGLSAGTTYYVVNQAQNSFQVSLAVGRLPIDLTSAGASVKVSSQKPRFKLAHDDVAGLSLLTVGGVTYTEISPGSQTGNVYAVNKTKGYVEFLTPPSGGTTIAATYQYYIRAWTQNPASHLVYLLTENTRGKGIAESLIDWDRAVAMRNYCDELVNWTNASGSFTEPRYTCNYAIDVRKPIQDHIRAVLDSAYACLFIANGKFIMRCRKPESSVFSFNTGNILQSSFSSELLDRSQRANRVNVFYHSKDTYNAETGVLRDDTVDQADRADRAGNLGIMDETLHMLAVDSETQAERLAETILRENINARWVGELKTNIKGLALEPMDVIDITHPSQPAWNQKLFRIEDISHDEADHLVIKFSEYFEGAYA